MSGESLRPDTKRQQRIAMPLIRVNSTPNVWAHRLTGGRLGGRFLSPH